MNQEDQSDEYPIVWVEPNIDLEENKGLKMMIEENKLIVLFSEAGKMLEFCKSLNMSFLLIVSNEELLKEFDKNLFHRRLGDFEEEIVLTRFLKEITPERPWRVYVFYTRKDFEEEVLTKEEVEKMMSPSGMKTIRRTRVFCEEFFSWDQNPKKEFSLPEDSENGNEASVENDFLECKEWCVRGLKDLVFKRKREKIKLMYFLGLAESKKNLKESKEALEHYEKVLRILLEIYGEVHPSTASVYKSFGLMHSRTKNHQKAQEYQAKALDIRKAVYGETHYLTADSYAWLGMALNELGQSQKALEYTLKCLEIEKIVFKGMHSYIANSYICIGKVYKKLQEHEKAIESFLEALEIRKSVYGETSGRVADSLHDLALAYGKLNQHEEVLECYFRAVEIRKLNNQENSILGAALYNDIGLTCYRLREYQKAIEYFAKALDIRQHIDGETPSRTLLVYYKNVARAYSDAGEPQQSLEHYLKALSIARSLHGEISSETGSIYRSLADTCKMLKKPEESVDYSVKSLGVSVSLNGEMNLNILGAHFRIATEYCQLLKLGKAFHYGVKGLNIQRFVQGENHHATELTYQGLEGFYWHLEKQQKELICDKKSLKMEKSLSNELAAKFRVMMRDENILGKRGAPSEDLRTEDFELDVEKKIKQ